MSAYLTTIRNGKREYRHRIIWFEHHGYWPNEIDHINGDIRDNRIENLRDTSHQGNCRNRRIHRSNNSGVSGVHWNKQRSKWQAYITNDDSKRVHLGVFLEWFDAVCARKAAEVVFGYHPNHGRV